MTIKELQEKAENYIQKGKTNLALQTLQKNKDSLEATDQTTIKLLSARYKKNENNYTIEGIIDQGSYAAELGAIRKALLTIISQLHLQNKLETYPSPPATPNLKLYAMVIGAVLIVVLTALVGSGNINITGNGATVIKGDHAILNKTEHTKDAPTQEENKETDILDKKVDNKWPVDQDDK